MVLALAATSLMSATVPAMAAQPPSIVQIVAHQDDDLLFMNPDIATNINNGYQTTTIFVTAGEGVVKVDDDPTPSPEEYAAQRQAGARQAYAAMAGVSGCALDSAAPGGCWAGSSPFFSGHLVQLFTLIGAPHIQLVFLNLPEHADERYLGGAALTKLRENPSLETDSLTMENAPAQHYDQGEVVGVLHTLLESYSATLVRAQDPAHDLDLYPDHDDHLAATWFADKAVERYSAAHPRVLLEHYRDYNIKDVPANLMPTQRDMKQRIVVDHYLPHDSHASQDDYFVAWEARQYSRAPRGTRWIGMDSFARLHAFVVAGGSLFEWYQDANFVWQGPHAHGNPGGPLAVGLTLAQNQDGRMEVFGQRADTGEIISRLQGVNGGWGWGSLGNPNESDRALRTSSPVVAANSDGRLQVFVRNGGGGISTHRQLQVNGPWNGSWADMGGSLIQGPPSVGLTLDGRIELFAATATGVLHWYQPTANGVFQSNPNFPQVRPASGLSVGMNHSGRLEVLYRQEHTANAMTLYQGAVGGGFNPAPANLGGHGGVGELAVAAYQSRIVVAERNGGGGVSVASQVAPDGGFGGWTDLGGNVVGPPAAATDHDGLTVLVALGYDGRLYRNQQDAGGSFGGWKLIS
jgi:LmbE family N-acetylglucosaminyl deacetylase